MNKRIISVLFLSLFCMGMGGSPGFGPGTSQTDRLFKAVIVDESQTKYDVQNLSVDGSTHLPAQAGAADASIDFGKVKTVIFYLQDDRVLTKVTFLDGDEMDFFVQPDLRFIGQTDWGQISFQARNIREISFR
ncbi:MAG: hypothetical protein ABR533_10990 [Desulfonatronovibrio sp.]